MVFIGVAENHHTPSDGIGGVGHGRAWAVRRHTEQGERPLILHRPRLPEGEGRHEIGVGLAAYGAGNAPSKEWFISLINKALAAGKIILNVTQCLAGSVNMDIYATGKCLKEAGMISGYDSTTESALGKLFYLLGRFEDNAGVQKFIGENLRGEISK